MADAIDEAYAVLRQSIIYFQHQPVGTLAADDPNAPAKNYHECFIRDFVPCAFVFLINKEPDIVRNFLQHVITLSAQQPPHEGHRILLGVLPASFRVDRDSDGREYLVADFGDHAIGRVAPVDSLMWWLLLLDAYVQATGDRAFLTQPRIQWGVISIVSLLLKDRYESFPTLIVSDGSFMIDRRMGVYGHPLEIQALFFGALRAAQRLLQPATSHADLIAAAHTREQELLAYIRAYYWMDPATLNRMHRYRTEEFGRDKENVFNIYPESIPDWIVDWLPDDAGYLIGNLGPGRVDFRFFGLGNMLSVLFGLVSADAAEQVLSLVATRWSDLVGMMPMKICFPALEGREWEIVTGCDRKNAPWSYHNGGSWPCLLWPLVAAGLVTGHRDLALRAVDIARHRLAAHHWPEYYDGRSGRMIGRQSNYRQTWTAAALILAQQLLDDPSRVSLLTGNRGGEQVAQTPATAR